MDRAIARALDNQGALGMYCNSLMINKALTGGLPENPPAPLEDVIDSSVKTGADLSRVKQWNYDNSRQILSSRTPIPRLLHGRLSIERGKRRPPAPIPTTNHWLDDIHRTLIDHIDHMEAAKAELIAATMPPQAVFDAAADDPQAIRDGGQLNAAYARAMKERPKPHEPPTPDDHEAARQAVEAALNRHPEHRHTAILRGAMVSAYMGEAPTSDTALWLMGGVDESQSSSGLSRQRNVQATRRKAGVAQKSIQALREVGVLDEIAQTEGGVVVYPGAATQQVGNRSAGITGVWFNWWRARAAQRGEPVPQRMQEVPRPQQRIAKRRIAHMAKHDFPGMRLTVTEQGGRLVTVTENGNLFGFLKGVEGVHPGDVIELGLATTKDGNMRVQYRPIQGG
jgi:hypothetical protein